MKRVEFNSVKDVHDYFGVSDEILHPLITCIDFSKIHHTLKIDHEVISNLYCVMHGETCVDEIMYGQTQLDFTHGTLVCFNPNQTVFVKASDQVNTEKEGWALYFHPDFIRRHHLANYINEYTFFEYETNEALHLSPKEKQKLNDIIQEIKDEFIGNIDRYSSEIVISNIELLLKHVQRFYSRQFITREKSNHTVVVKFEKYLKSYIKHDYLEKEGMLTVQKTAKALYLSPNYLGDLLKRETGKNATEHIHLAVVEQAKNYLLQSDDSIKNIAYQLGFEYSQSFSKMFKGATGVTPTNYRLLN